MHIRNVEIRHFRSIEKSGLHNCGGLNVLIGKNNAGKSNLLTAVELFLRHLKRGLIAVIQTSRRAADQFTDRQTRKPYRIAVEFDLPPDINSALRERLSAEAPHLDRSIEQIKANNNIVFVIAGVSDGNESWVFVEQIVVGGLSSEEEIQVGGIRLLSVSASVGKELAHIQAQVGSKSAELKRMQQLTGDRRWQEFVVERRDRLRASYPYNDSISQMSREHLRTLESALASVTSPEGVVGVLNQMIAETRDEIDQLRKQETVDSLTAFAGSAKVPPAYSVWLMEVYGSVQVLHLQETKAPIGKDESDTLLDMKLQRGGMERLQTLQQTIRALLGVDVDAFQARMQGGERVAEMDVDNFLVEANGAGIRESLRLILDIELKEPQLVLVEEPEVHLHPGLSRVMATYLRDRSRDMQMFVTTHSTEFVDSVAFQNAYLVSRDPNNKTVCQSITAAEGPLLLPAELGLRLSTVFMFDRLLFVEGPSDEAVFRTVARNLQIDLTKSNVGFVHMCGVRNFAHFAAQGTLDLLSRRQIEMWFIADRDERDDEEVKRMIERLGNRAQLKVLDRRELENYLLDAEAVRAFIREKSVAAGQGEIADNSDTVRKVIEEKASSLKDEVIRLRIVRRALAPVFMNVRTAQGSIEERLKAAVQLLNARLEKLTEDNKAVEAQVNEVWAAKALNLAPGTLVLEKVAEKYGVKFSKENGDSERLAGYLGPEAIPFELKTLLKEISV